MYFFSLLLFFNCFLLTKAIPLRCDQLSISANDYGNDLNTTVSLVIEVSDGIGGNFVTVKNLTRSFQQSSRDTVKSLENANITVCISDQCYANFVGSVSAVVGNGVFDVTVSWNLFSEDFSYHLFNGIVDQRNLIFNDGSLFDEDKQCMVYNDIDYLPSLKTCCTSFKSIPEASSNSTKCTNFKATSSIFEMPNNNLIATNYANFVLNDDYISSTWHYITDPRFSHIFSINNVECQKAPNGIQYCSYFIGNQNKELLIQDGFIEEFVGGPNVLIGRIILRDDQTLTEEGIPFSASNQCQNFAGVVTLQLSGNVTLRVMNQFCCSDFDAPATPPTPITTVPTPMTTVSTSPTTPSPTKLIGLQCDKISTFTSDGTDNITTNIQIKNINGTNFINVTDIQITVKNISDVSVCIRDLIGTGASPDPTCQNVTANSANFILPNKMIKMDISYLVQSGGLYIIQIFNGMIDAGNFASVDGVLFDDNENKCFKFGTFSANTTFCCTSLNKNSQSPVYYPKCTNFAISSTFYNSTTENVYASAAVDFALSDFDLTGKGYYSGNIPTLFSFNNYGFQKGINKTQFGGFPIQDLNSEFFIQISYYSNIKTYDSVFVGRIILLEGHTFLEQGIPLTVSNNCLNVSLPYQDIDGQNGIDVVSQLCCTVFDGNVYPITTTKTTVTQSSIASTSKTTTNVEITSPKPNPTTSTTILTNTTTSAKTSTISTDPLTNSAISVSFNLSVFLLIIVPFYDI